MREGKDTKILRCHIIWTTRFCSNVVKIKTGDERNLQQIKLSQRSRQMLLSSEINNLLDNIDNATLRQILHPRPYGWSIIILALAPHAPMVSAHIISALPLGLLGDVYQARFHQLYTWTSFVGVGDAVPAGLIP
jgi:hypothetical protein